MSASVPRLEPGRWLQMLDTEYLAEYIPSGGSAVKVLSGDDATLGGVAAQVRERARSGGFYYAHLDRYAPGLHEGTLLRKGDVLGYVGTTGDAPANTPHLHLAVFKLGADKKWWTGTPVDPLPLLQ